MKMRSRHEKDLEKYLLSLAGYILQDVEHIPEGSVELDRGDGDEVRITLRPPNPNAEGQYEIKTLDIYEHDDGSLVFFID